MVMSENFSCRLRRPTVLGLGLLTLVALLGWTAAPIAATSPVELDPQVAPHQDPEHFHDRGHRHPAGMWHDDDSPRWTTTVNGRVVLSSSIDRLVLETGVGSIHLRRGRGRDLTIAAKVKVKEDRVSADELTDRFADHVEVRDEGRELFIRNAHRHDHDDGNPWSIDLTIEVPRPLAVEATSGAGGIHIEEAEGEVSLVCGAGDIELNVPEADLRAVSVTSGAGGVVLVAAGIDSVTATSGAGSVKLDCRRHAPRSDVSLKTGAGGITIQVPASLSGSFDMSTGVGSIDVDPDLGLTVRRRRVGASASGTIGRGETTYRLHSGTGSIRLQIQ